MSGEVKYLGAALYSGLTCKALDEVILKAKKALCGISGTCGKTWGLRPKMIHWLYTRTVLPIITYGRF